MDDEMQNLENEIEAGRSTIITDGAGDVERIALVVVFQVEDV